MILNTFPELLTYGVLSPFILRVVIGFIIINLGLLKLGKEKKEWEELFETINFHPAKYFTKILSFIEIIGGLMLLIGSYTQIIAIIFAITFFCEAVLEYREESLESRSLPFYILIFAISLSLIFSGAGAFSFDLPL
jgi:uncharacterized membrane protein YphA (DoxX/SURF4 family)